MTMVRSTPGAAIVTGAATAPLPRWKWMRTRICRSWMRSRPRSSATAAGAAITAGTSTWMTDRATTRSTTTCCFSGGLKFREGFRRRAWNNIMVNNGFHPHVWYDQQRRRSVLEYLHGRRHRAVETAQRRPPTGKRVDGTCSSSPIRTVKDRFVRVRMGRAIRSSAIRCSSIRPGGDFRVKEGSPAFEIGFKNFPMDQFGVKKPSLKAIAKTPVIPALDIGSTEGTPSNARGANGSRQTSSGSEPSCTTWKAKSSPPMARARKTAESPWLEVPKTSEAARCGLTGKRSDPGGE